MNAASLKRWPNCITPDCENKRCIWAATPYCFPCSRRVLGGPEMIRRYNATHELTWEETQRLDAEEERLDAEEDGPA